MRNLRSQPKDYIGESPIYQRWMEKEFIYKTMHMHWQARLFYRALLQAAPHATTRPDLPDDDTQLQIILGGVPKDVWGEHRDAVRAMFTVDAAKGVLWQKHLREDWNQLEDIRNIRRELGRKGGNAKAKRSKSQAKAKQNPSKAVANRSIAEHSKAEQSIENLPSNPVVEGGSGGSVSISYPKPGEPQTNGNGAGKKDLSGWRLDFQTEIQKIAAENTIVFGVPLPDAVFDYVEKLADTCGMMKAQKAVFRWLEARSFDNLVNPNVVWDKMSDEIVGFVEQVKS